jgi:hypothetical protein
MIGKRINALINFGGCQGITPLLEICLIKTNKHLSYLSCMKNNQIAD